MRASDPSSAAPRQRNWQYAFVGWILATIVVWLLICVWLDRGQDWQLAFYFALLNHHCWLLGFWSGLGHWKWRHLVTMIAFPVVTLIASAAVDGSDLEEFGLYCATLVGLVAVTSGVLRLWKGCLCRVATDSFDQDALQFGIKHVIVWTAALAFLFGLARYAFSTYQIIDVPSLGATFLILGLAASVGIGPVVGIWALLGHRVTFLKLLVLVLGGTCMTIASHQLVSRTAVFAAATALCLLIAVVSLLLLRLQGLRFVKSSPEAGLPPE